MAANALLIASFCHAGHAFFSLELRLNHGLRGYGQKVPGRAVIEFAREVPNGL